MRRTTNRPAGYEFPPPEKQKHEEKATTAGILSGEVTECDCAVEGVMFSVHVKRGAPPGHPRTMRVEYRIGFNEYRSEWICFEHNGYARQKAAPAEARWQ